MEKATTKTFGRVMAVAAVTIAMVMALGLAACSGGQQSGSSASKITVSVKVDGNQANKGIIYDGTVTIDKGSNVYDALVATGLDMVSDNSAGAYVSSIGGLSDKDGGSMSGWLYAVNGSSATVSADAYELADGDSVVWTWVYDYTETDM